MASVERQYFIENAAGRRLKVKPCKSKITHTFVSGHFGLREWSFK